LETPQDTNDILIVSDAAGGRDPALLEKIVKEALTSSSFPYADVFRFEANMIDVTFALSSPSQWKVAIRALCQAKVAFMDISNISPGTMMLLGVRSVVRRGVTITLRTHEGSLPWNIREIKPVELHKLRSFQEKFVHFASVLAEDVLQLCSQAKGRGR
jgi:hypothetical protein